VIKKILKVVFQVLFVLLFISISSYALLTAYGYQVDLLKQNIVKTSIIDLANTIEEAKVYYNNELVAEKTPFQIKNVEPGSHYLLVLKDGYKPWQRKVEVELNVVTKINDILLMPISYDKYGKNFDLGFTYDTYLSNRKWILFISKSNNKIHAYKMNADGSFLIDTINISLDKDYTFSFAGDDNLVYKYKDKLSMLNLSDKTILNATIPDEFKYFRLAFSPSLKGFYVNAGGFYSADIDNKGSINEITLLTEDVSFIKGEFDLTNFGGHSFVLSQGVLFDYYDNKIQKIDTNVSELPYFTASNGEIIYVKNYHEIIKYKLEDRNREFIGRFDIKIDFLSWFFDNKHFYLKTEKNIKVCDFSFENCAELITVTGDDKIIAGSNDNQFAVLTKNQIVSYTYDTTGL
jgi:hypothetical protein